MAKKILKVGFDFDGVIADNPLKMFRQPANFVLKLFFKKQILTYYPKSTLEQSFWRLIHRFSFFPSRGFEELKQLLKEHRIEAYLITGRYALLEHELHDWLKKHAIEKLFTGYFVNKQNEHPHVFKERMIKKLGLDIFVEDNWDIVEYLNSKFQNPNSKSPPKRDPAKAGQIQNLNVQNSKQFNNVEIHWIYNILDRFKTYKHKHPHLGSFIKRGLQGLALRG